MKLVTCCYAAMVQLLRDKVEALCVLTEAQGVCQPVLLCLAVQ